MIKENVLPIELDDYEDDTIQYDVSLRNVHRVTIPQLIEKLEKEIQPNISGRPLPLRADYEVFESMVKVDEDEDDEEYEDIEWLVDESEDFYSDYFPVFKEGLLELEDIPKGEFLPRIIITEDNEFNVLALDPDSIGVYYVDSDCDVDCRNIPKLIEMLKIIDTLKDRH
jgi:hypothetical protein